MKKDIVTLLIILIPLIKLNGQENNIYVSGDFNQIPLKEFIHEIEQKNFIKFYYDDKIIDTLTVSASFYETPLAKCLETILERKQINFFISGNLVVIYSGFLLSDLFPGGDPYQVSNNNEVTGIKLSRENLHELQYRIINIGIPGKNKTRTATLSGYLKNYETGEPVIGGLVYGAEIRNGVSSDHAGFYKITLPTGNQIVNFSSMGMEPARRNLNLYSSGNLDVEMEVRVRVLDDAVIIGHGKGNLGQMHIGMERIDNIMLKSIPSLLGESDVMKSVLTLPGVQTVGEGTSGFNVRGGNTDQNLILIDQAPIYYPSHFFGNFSAINSEIIDNATLYKGSIPVKYGGRISSVFEVNTIDGNHDKISGSAGISPISARINFDGPLFSKKSTFFISFRSTYSNWLLKRIHVPELYKSKAGFYDAQAKLNLWLNDNNILLVNIYISKDKFQLQNDTKYNYNNFIASLTLKHKFNSYLKSNTSLICSLFKYVVDNNNTATPAYSLTHQLSNTSIIQDFEYFTNGRLKYGFGASMNAYSINPGEKTSLNHSNVIPLSFSNEHAVEFGIYAGNEYNVSGNLKIESGIRLSGLASFDDGKKYMYAVNMPIEDDNIVDTVQMKKNRIGKTYMNPEFRISVNYSIGRNGSLKFSYNKTAQYIHMLSNTAAISPTDTWKLSDRYLLPAKGNQISAGYFRNFRKNGLEASAEAFYKKIQNLKEFKAGAELLLNDHIETEIINGTGKSYGLELSLSKSGGRLYGRVDYTLSRTLIRSVSNFSEELINDGEYFPANYDKPHNLNLLANLKISRRLIFSTIVNYSTGRPITYPVSKYKIGDQVFLQYSKYNQYRISDYFRTDLSVTLSGNLKKNHRTHSSVNLSLYNVTGRKNAYSVYFKSESGKFVAYKLSIFGTVIPTLTYNIKF